MELFLQKLFIDIVNMSLTASYVILFVLAARLLLKKAPKIFSYSLWIVVLFRLICPFSFSSAFSLLQKQVSNSGKIEYIPSNIVMMQPQSSIGINEMSSTVNTSLPVSINNSASFMHTILFVSSLTWVLGIVFLMIYSIISYLLLKHKLCTAILVRNNIFECENIYSPFVLGFVKPRIYVPKGLHKEETSYIVKHEQIHIKRFDYLIKPAAFLVLCLHWFNPLVWISFVLMSKDIEMSCDERVLKELGTEIKKDYSTSLLSLAVSKITINGSPLAFGENNTKTRIKNVLNYKKPVFWVFLAAVIIIVCTCIGLITNPSPMSKEKNNFTAKVYKYKTPYIGDNSKVVNIAKELPVPETLSHAKVQLFTDKEPYGMQITYQTTNDVKESFLRKDNQTIFDENAAVIFALVGNAQYVNFVISTEGHFNRIIQRNRTWANNVMASDLWKNSADFKGFNRVYKEIMNKFTTIYSLPVLLESGKNTNIKSVSDVPPTAIYDEVKSNSEIYYIYKKDGKYYIEKPHEFINEITKEKYGKLHTLIVSQNLYENMKQEVSLDAKKYFLKKTLKDSCILDNDGLINTGSELADKFISDTQNGKKSSIKIIHSSADNYIDITKVIYDGKNYYGVKYIPADYFTGTPSYYYEFRFKYIKALDLSGYKFVYLLEDNNETFKDINNSMLSRNSKDWVDSHFLYAITK